MAGTVGGRVGRRTTFLLPSRSPGISTLILGRVRQAAQLIGDKKAGRLASQSSQSVGSIGDQKFGVANWLRPRPWRPQRI